MIPSMDPDLKWGKDCLLVRLLDGSPHVGDRETIKKCWIFPKRRLESHLDAIRKVDEEIEVLAKAQVLAPESRENLETKIIRRKAAKDEWQVEMLKGIVFKKIEEIEGLEKKERDFMLEIEEEKVLRRKTEDDAKSRVAFAMDALTRKVNDDKVEIELLQKQLAEKSRRTNVLQWRLKKMDMLLEHSQKKAESDKETHRLECDALRLQVESSGDCIPRKRKKHSTPIYLDETIWELAEKVVDDPKLSARMKSVEKTNPVSGGQKEDSTDLTKLKSNLEPEHGGDVV